MEPIKFFLPGPAYVPMDAREAMLQPMVAHRSPFFKELYTRMTPRLAALFRTSGDVMIATGSSTLDHGERRDLVRPVGRAQSDPGSFLRALARHLQGPGQERRPGRGPVGTGHGSGRRPCRSAAQKVRGGHPGPQRDLDRRHERPGGARAGDPRGERGADPCGRRLLPGRRAGRDRRLGARRGARRHPEGLAAPPGLCVFSLSQRAAARARQVPHRGFYTDLLRYQDKHREGGPITTPGLPLVYALAVQLDRIAGEGIEARWERHRNLYDKTAGWAAARGCAYASAADARSLTVSCLYPPAGADPQGLVQELGRRGYTVERRLRRLETDNVPHRPHGRGAGDRSGRPAG